MARQTGSEIIGRVEGLIFYERESEFLVRAVPEQDHRYQESSKTIWQSLINGKNPAQTFAAPASRSTG